MAYLTGIFDSSEGSDRRTLAFSDADNAMVSAVAKAQKNTIVVMVNPGAVLTPWTDDVAAALTMFMPGLVTRNDAPSTPISSACASLCMLNQEAAGFFCQQEMGNAISDVLFGDVNPSGRLALTFPNKDNEVGFTQAQYPGVKVSTGLESTYSEKLEIVRNQLCTQLSLRFSS